MFDQIENHLTSWCACGAGFWRRWLLGRGIWHHMRRVGRNLSKLSRKRDNTILYNIVAPKERFSKALCKSSKVNIKFCSWKFKQFQVPNSADQYIDIKWNHHVIPQRFSSLLNLQTHKLKNFVEKCVLSLFVFWYPKIQEQGAIVNLTKTSHIRQVTVWVHERLLFVLGLRNR